VLIAGKGHEPYQEVKGSRTPFSDVEQGGLALAQWRPRS
jgi:UDP-N-acetylmuramoyl-L-alanyl-D-glutamate--2,6-diaminopimelate ligase